MNDKQKRYEELRDHFNDVLANGGTISDAEHAERVRLHYEVNGIEPIDFSDVAMAVTSSDPKDGGIIFTPKGKHTAK